MGHGFHRGDPAGLDCRVKADQKTEYQDDGVDGQHIFCHEKWHNNMSHTEKFRSLGHERHVYAAGKGAYRCEPKQIACKKSDDQEAKWR